MWIIKHTVSRLFHIGGLVDALFAVLKPIRVRYRDILCQILLPAQACNHAITPDSDQTNIFPGT